MQWKTISTREFGPRYRLRDAGLYRTKPAKIRKVKVRGKNKALIIEGVVTPSERRRRPTPPSPDRLSNRRPTPFTDRWFEAQTSPPSGAVLPVTDSAARTEESEDVPVLHGSLQWKVILPEAQATAGESCQASPEPGLSPPAAAKLPGVAAQQCTPRVAQSLAHAQESPPTPEEGISPPGTPPPLRRQHHTATPFCFKQHGRFSVFGPILLS